MTASAKRQFWLTLLLACLSAGAALALYPALKRSEACTDWPLWTAFLHRFVQPDGRVIDFQRDAGITTSEGQAYTLFFALVANDRAQFNQVLEWADRNLARSELGNRLPAWLWGRRVNGEWGILDPNNASDADIWMAYSLIEAGRLWNEPSYSLQGLQLLTTIERTLIIHAPGAGPLLLPGANGFQTGEQSWMLNPSYVPIQLMRRFQAIDSSGSWDSIAGNTLASLEQASAAALAPDWVRYQAGTGWMADPEKGPWGSYDAIRNYLWAGMLSPEDPLQPRLMAALSGMLEQVPANIFAAPPSRVNTDTGDAEGRGPAGFSAALLPYLAAMGAHDLTEAQTWRIRRKSFTPLLGEHQNYYDQVLGLFGQGWAENRYRFSADGSLMPAWASGCN